MNGVGNGYYRDDSWDQASRTSSFRYRGQVYQYGDGYPEGDPGYNYEGGYPDGRYNYDAGYPDASYPGPDGYPEAAGYAREPPPVRPGYGSGYDRGRMSPYRSDPRGHTTSNGYSSDNGSVVSTEDGPTYVLEHLATFRVSPESDLVYPADGMRRLLHMEKTSGIWTQKMMLKLDRKWIYILSHENGDIVEKFPLELIREPTAFTSDDPKELYNNIFIFVVAEDPKRNYQNPTEMHIFQCLRISAKDVVEDMKLFMSGKGVAGRVRAGRPGRGEHIPPPPQEPAPEPPLPNGYRDYSDSEVRGEARGPRSERSSVSHNDDGSSTSSEKYERDVAILNSCFDDIERFIARLQHTAAATRELEHRRRSRKSKKKDIGDGLLSMRAKPPPEREFVDIFQKFKLSFNLLAKLKAHIHDPNAPELVHFLFTPLALIVDASRDSNYGPNLPSKVLSPLLTADAVELLTNCLTSRETEIWQSLGDAWCIPRSMWKYSVPPYQPVFSNGWAPELLEDSRDRGLASEVVAEAKRNREAELRQGRLRSEEYGSDFYDSDRQEQYYRRDDRPRSQTPPSEYPQAGRSDISQESVDPSGFDKLQQRYLNELKARRAKIVQVTYPRTANNDKELTVVRGEYLEVLDDSRKWWKAVNARGQAAHVPHTIVTPYTADQDGKDDYHADVRPNAPQPVWNERKGKKDYRGMNSSDEDDDLPERKMSSIPVPPPLPPPEATPTHTAIKPRPKKTPRPTNADHMYGTTKSTAEIMNAELKLVLEGFRRQRPHLDIAKTPDVYINQNSTPEEVQNWLEMKGFSGRIRKQFDGVDGEKMFALDRAQLEMYCGAKEGARLASQILVQRNVSGYKTARSSELKQVLAKMRNKVDSNPPGANTDKPEKHMTPDRPDKPQKIDRIEKVDRQEKIDRHEKLEKAEENVEKNFEFLSGYQSDSESEEEFEKAPNRGTNTLKEQIMKKRKQIIGQNFNEKASR